MTGNSYHRVWAGRQYLALRLPSSEDPRSPHQRAGGREHVHARLAVIRRLTAMGEGVMLSGRQVA